MTIVSVSNKYTLDSIEQKVIKVWSCIWEKKHIQKQFQVQEDIGEEQFRHPKEKRKDD